MPINNRFVWMDKDTFNSALEGTLSDAGDMAIDGEGQLENESIVFIRDKKEIWTHGNLYKSVNWSELKLITFFVSDVEYKAIKDMTFEKWVNSKYNTNGFYCNNSYVYTKEDVPLRWHNGDYVSSSTIILNSSHHDVTGGGSN